MKLSTKGRYAVTAMMNIAIHRDRGPVTLAEISQCQDISLSYLEQLFARLRRQGLVTGVRGPGGGYRLARPANEISVAQIIEAVDESMDMTQCGGEANCHGGQRCLSHDLWLELSQKLHDFLDGITLEDFTNRPETYEVAERQQQRIGLTPWCSTCHPAQ